MTHSRRESRVLAAGIIGRLMVRRDWPVQWVLSDCSA